MFINKNKTPIEDKHSNTYTVPITRRGLYNELSKVITGYKSAVLKNNVNPECLYEMLVKIQNNWEDVITADDSKSIPNTDERFERTVKELKQKLEKAYRFIMLSQGINPEEIVDIEIPVNYKMLLINRQGSKIIIDVMSNK